MAQLLPRSGADRGRPKTILILAMEPLFPKVRASQERIYRMAERLARDHTVDVATTVRNPVELEQSREHLRAVCRAFHPITPINPQGSQLRRKLRRAEYLLLHAPRHHPHHYFYGGHRRVTAQVADIVRRPAPSSPMSPAHASCHQSATSPRKMRLTSADWSSSADGPERMVRPDSRM